MRVNKNGWRKTTKNKRKNSFKIGQKAGFCLHREYLIPNISPAEDSMKEAVAILFHNRTRIFYWWRKYCEEEGKKLKGIEKSKRHCHMQLHTFWYNKSRIKLKSTVKTIVREMHEFFRYDESIWTRIRFKKDISIGAFSICTALQHFIIIHSGVFFHLFLCFFQ